MTDIATTYDRKLEDSPETPPVISQPVATEPNTVSNSGPSSTESPVLITEQQVLFSTAAAVALPPARTRRFTEALRAVAASVKAAFATSGDEPRPQRRHYPPRNDYLEDARMAREMYRL
jgi:hypothetical protein